MHKRTEGKRGVLLVEDSQDLAQLLAMMLRSKGLRVEVATSAAEAEAHLKQFRPVAILTDLTLGPVSAIEWAPAVRNGLGYPCRLVAMTGWSIEEVGEKVQHAGFDALLTKPVTLDALLPALLPVSLNVDGGEVG